MGRLCHVAKYYNYSARDFTTQLERYDVIFDAVGRSSFVICRLHLVPGGLFVTTPPTPSLFFWSGVQSITGIFSNVRRAKGILVRPSGKDIAFLGKLVNEGKPDIFSRSRGRGTCSE